MGTIVRIASVQVADEIREFPLAWPFEFSRRPLSGNSVNRGNGADPSLLDIFVICEH
jgi:hypothetical protein